MGRIRSKTHPLDTHIFRHDTEHNPLPTFHFTHCQGIPCTVAVEVEIYSCYIALDFVDRLELNLESHPTPRYFEDGSIIRHQCQVPISVGTYEDQVLCDVVDIKGANIILGREWMQKQHVCYNKKMKTFIYPWMKDIHSLTQDLLFIMPSLQPKPRMHKWRVRYDKKMKTSIYPWMKPEPETFLTVLESVPEPVVESEPLLELEPEMEPDPVSEPEIDVFVAEPVPTPEPEAVSGLDPTPKLVPESAPE